MNEPTKRQLRELRKKEAAWEVLKTWLDERIETFGGSYPHHRDALIIVKGKMKELEK